MLAAAAVDDAVLAVEHTRPAPAQVASGMLRRGSAMSLSLRF